MKNKKELWKIESKLAKSKDQTKKLVSLTTEQAQKEKQQLLNKLQSLGLISNEADTGQILGLSLKDLLERRLQTIVYKKSLARSITQARQFVVHGHIFVDGRKITKPNHLVTVKEQGLITFSPSSSLSDEMHPERIEKKVEKKEKKTAKKEEVAEEIIPEEELKKTTKVVEGND